MSERIEVVIWRVGSWGSASWEFSVWMEHGGGCGGILFVCCSYVD